MMSVATESPTSKRHCQGSLYHNSCPELTGNSRYRKYWFLFGQPGEDGRAQHEHPISSSCKPWSWHAALNFLLDTDIQLVNLPWISLYCSYSSPIFSMCTNVAAVEVFHPSLPPCPPSSSCASSWEPSWAFLQKGGPGEGRQGRRWNRRGHATRRTCFSFTPKTSQE